MVEGNKILRISLFIIGCCLIYYGFYIANCKDERINTIPWAWLFLIGIIISIFSSYRLIKS